MKQMDRRAVDCDSKPKYFSELQKYFTRLIAVKKLGN